MAADTLAPDGAAVTISPPPADSGGHPYTFWGYAVAPGSDEIITLAASGAQGSNNDTVNEITATGYSLAGAQAFQTVLSDMNGQPFALNSPSLALLANGDVAFAWNSIDYLTQAGQADNVYAVVSPSGSIVGQGDLPFDHGTDQYGAYSVPIMGPPILYATGTGFGMEWNEESRPFDGNTRYGYAVETFDMAGGSGDRTVTPESGWDQITPTPHAFAAGALSDLQLADNAVQYFDGASLQGAVTIPGEPAHAITDEAAAMLANGQAAVAWVDSGTDYVSLFDPATNSFGPRIGLDWGGASDIHALALPDGGFAVSWMNGGAYKGEVFTADGTGGGIIALAGDVAGIDSHGDLFTVGMDSSGNEVVQTYAINGSGGASGGGSGGQTFTSDNNGDTWVGTSANDTFHLGRGGDTVTGNGGDDTYSFAETPWAGSHITDFNAGDVLDLTGLAHKAGDQGSDGFADGYLSIANDAQGDAQVWASYSSSGSNPWLVTTLDGVSAASLTHQGDVIRIAGSGGGAPPPPSSVQTSDANYTAPDSVTSITLTGSNQTVHANNHDTTIYSDNGANTIYGGTGDDVIHIGRGGDTVTGGAGKDVFVFDDIPWAPATITDVFADFNNSAGDTINVQGLLAKAGYTGSDPVADGYLKQTQDNAGYHIWANYNQAGNSGWWEIANYVAPTALTLTDGVYQSTTHSGTWTTSAGGGVPSGYDGAVMTGSNGSLNANDGGDTLIDNGSNNTLGDGRGNDTLVLSPTTKEVFTGWGGLDTIVLNAHPTVATFDPYALTAGDRIDLHPLLAGMGYTGSDPIADGYIKVDRLPQDFGQMAPNSVRVSFDPDGPSGSAPWSIAFQANGYTPTPHYSDGWLIV